VTPPAAAAAPAVHPADRRSAGRAAPRRPLTAPPRPRRVSGPARRPLGDRPAHRRAEDQGGIALGLIAALGRLSEHRLLDRLIRGRTWIAIVAFALIGIVTMQLVLLKLNASVGRSLESEASLQRENAALSIENSELAAGHRVESSAVGLGMEVVPIGALRFLTARTRTDVRRGAEALNTPVSSATTGPAEASAGQGTQSATSATSSEAPAAAPGTSTTSAQTSTPPSEEARPPSGESASSSTGAQPSGETSSAPAPSQAGASAPGGAAGEGSAAGGTQAGSSG